MGDFCSNCRRVLPSKFMTRCEACGKYFCGRCMLGRYLCNGCMDRMNGEEKEFGEIEGMVIWLGL